MKRFTLCFLAVLLFFSMGVTCLASSMPYVGNKSTKVYHMVECTWGRKIGLDNRIYFASREQAERCGYRRCHYCGDGVVGAGNGGGSSNNKNPVSNNSTTDVEDASKTDSTSNGVHPLFWLAVGILLAWAIYCFVQQWRTNIKEVKAIRENNQKVLQSLNCENVLVPQGVVLLPDGTPTIGATSAYRPYGNYTVYLSPSGRKIHANPRCCRKLSAFHLFEVPASYAPCKNCAKCIQVPSKLPDWYCEIMKGKAKKPAESTQPHPNTTQRVNNNKVASSVIKSVAYTEQGLILEFQSGAAYLYYNAPQEVHDELIRSQSPGKYFHEKINGVYPYAPYHE